MKKQSKPGEVKQAVVDAITAGYRHIDCAFAYGNEEEVGAGIKQKIDDGTVTRNDLFITSKVLTKPLSNQSLSSF
jgi:aldehyde reductase